MKIRCDSSVISEACSLVARAASSKSSIKEQEGILFQTTEQGVRLTAYDLSIAVITVIDATIAEEGAVVIGAKILCELLKYLPEDTVEIDVNDKFVCTIKSGVSVYEINGVDPEGFPEVPYVNGGEPVVIEQKILRDMIRQTVFAVSPDDSRVAHRGIKFELEENTVRAVALDNYRIALRTEATECNIKHTSFILPLKTVNEIGKFLNDDDGFVSINPGNQFITISMNGYNFVSRLLEGEFLDYKRALPKDIHTEVRIKTGEMLNKLTSMALLVDERMKNPVKCNFEDNVLRLSMNSSSGMGDTEMNVSMTGDNIEIGFNVRFLMDAIRATESDEIVIKMGSPFSPAAIVPIEGESFYYLVLPVRFR